MARDQGWMAEHMLVLGVTSPAGEVPRGRRLSQRACGKTQLRDAGAAKALNWKVTTVGDDIAWIKAGRRMAAHAINLEAGFFGVAPGTNQARPQSDERESPKLT